MSLTYIFYLCIEQNVLPSEFQKAKVIPLAKTRDHKNLNYYRPISLLSVLSELLERHVHKHLVTYLETRDIFHPLQSGFHRKHSCNTALARLSDSWLSDINRSDLSGDVFLIFKNIFDLVDHRILLSKLSVYLNSSNSLPFEPELPATPTQTSWGEGDVGFFQCRLGYKDDSAWFMAEEVTLAM